MANCATCGQLMPFGMCRTCGLRPVQPGGPRVNAPVQPAFGQQNLQHRPLVAPVLAPVLAPGALPIGAVLQISCARAGRVQFAVLNPANTLFVLKDVELEFRASATGVPQGFSFALATWGGTCGAAGQSGSKRVRFSNRSLAIAAPVTVTLTFGGQNVAINVVVYDLSTTAVMADAFAGRSATDLGVDERVSLGFATNPVGITAAQIGGLRWGFADGAAAGRNSVGVLHDPATNAAPLPALQTGVVNYIAPVRTFPTGGMPAPRKLVTLKLAIVGGLCADMDVSLPYTICSPVAHMREQAGGARRHVNGKPSSGFKGVIFFTPRDVSFRTLRFREGTGLMEVDPPFPANWAVQHGATVATGDAALPISAGDSVTGCTVVGAVDDVYSGAFDYVVPSMASASTIIARQQWPIIWEYVYQDLPPAVSWTNDFIKMQRAYHRAALYQNGAVTMFKGHEDCATNDCMRTPLRKEIGDPSVA